MTEEYLKWLKQLINDNELDKFYHDAKWLKTADVVKRLDNYECQSCKRKGRITTAGMLNAKGKPIQMSVHHKKEVKKHPELALSIFYYDENGNKKRNLEYTCEQCHNKFHKKFEAKKVNKFINEEKW